MIRRKLSQALAWMTKTMRGFISNPLYMVGMAGVIFGLLVVVFTSIMTAMAFLPSIAAAPLAAVVAPLLRDIILAMMAMVAIVSLVFLGFKNFAAEFMGMKIQASAQDVKEASEKAADALDDLADSVAPENP